jgi:hypothetical protein
MIIAMMRESEKLTSLTVGMRLEAKYLKTLKMNVDGRVKKARGILIKKLLSR